MAALLAGALATTTQGCELVVQLDRSAVDAGGDAVCAICSDVGADGGAEAAAEAADAASADRGGDGAAPQVADGSDATGKD